ncbi:hypothetical protein TRFO_17123 [Tritrichomonas foetus]|uniref:Uncharacterized protein n=1 Tax=Tritrichomonas foetus TaxID=1144522 RepID=A0A1J4KP28_9EUKA|nr:hypothetical protein TRFO_17123 [Tritrichomonas foetus]|eukprot:OHT12866.1 hypothetical protein TRFO_17123 [Tritrichomonas foetus]
MIPSFASFDYLTEEEIKEKLEQMKMSHMSSSQTISIIKKLLSSTSEPEMVIEEIPNLLVCTSNDFLSLYPVFNSLIMENPLCVSSLLTILPSFDYDSSSKPQAHELAIEIFEKIEDNQIPVLIPFLLNTISNNTISLLYTQLKDILTVHENPSYYKVFEESVRPHLTLFFNCVKNENNWTFFDFFILLISQIRPNLRTHIPNLVWNSIIKNTLTFSDLESFFEHAEIITPRYHLLTSLFDIMMNNVPKCYEISAIYSLSKCAIKIIECYSNLSSNFIDDMISYVLNGTDFLANIASNCLNNIMAQHFYSHVLDLDDCLSQSNYLSSIARHTLCNLIAKSVIFEQQQQSVLMISLQKKLFHPSLQLVEAGISLALHLKDLLNFDEIFEWILKAISVNRLVEASVNPSVLLSVIDLIWSIKDTIITNRESLKHVKDFCWEILKQFQVIVTLNKKDSTIGNNRNKYTISTKNILSDQHAELCGEAIVLLNYIHNKILNESHGKNNDEENYEYSENEDEIEGKNKFLNDISLLCFKVPAEFISMASDTNNDKIKLKSEHIRILNKTRSMMVPIIYRLKSDDIAIIRYYMEIINKIDEFFLSPNVIKMRTVSNLFEFTYFPIDFVFNILMESFFEFPDDLNLLYLLFNSLYVFFIDSVTHRFALHDKISFVNSSLPENFIPRIVTIISRIIHLSVLWRKESNMLLVKRCIRAASYGLDFIAFCISCGINTDFNYSDDAINMLSFNEDAGIACRLILLGYFMNINKSDLANLAKQCFDEQKLTCDLCETRNIYPFGFPDLNEVVRPMNEGANWRLLVYLSLQFSDFDSFEEQFNRIVDQINDQRIEIQMCFLLIDLLISRLEEFHFDYFEQIIEISFKLFKVFTLCDLTILRAINKLLHNINAIQKKNNIQFDYSPDLPQFFQNKFQQFGNIQNKTQLKNTIALIQGECELLFNTK